MYKCAESLDHPHEHDSSGHKEGTACTSHLEAAFDQYSGYINQLRCICRSVLEQSATMGHKCCGGHHKTPGVLSSGARGSRGCSGKKKQDRWGNEKQADKCGNPTISGVFKPSRQKGNREVGDVEGKKSEAVSFIVSGMDCTSCADKLVRILGGMAGISQPHVNFVRGDGQFNLDPSITDAEEALSFATNASGFGLAKVVGGEFYLDILLSPTETASLADDPPSGVLDVQPWGKKITRVSYDPAMVGARDLYDSLKDRCGGLAPPQADPQLESSRRRLKRQLINTVIAAAFTIPVCVIAFGHNLVDERAGAIVCLVLATVVQGVAVLEFYRPALRALWYSHIVEMDMLVVMSVSAAYVYSVIAFGFQMAGKPLKQEQFFETSTLLITLILGGRLVAAYARVQAVSSVSLRSQQSTKAILVREGGEEEIDARLLQYGDRFKVAPHSRIPTDGTVVSGTTEVNESMVTGESMPVMKKTGDILIAGTINGDGAVTASLIRLPGKNTVTDIAQLVEDASNSRPKLQDLANKVASWFVPVMASIALVVFVVWIAVGFKVKHWGAGESVGNAVTYAVAVLAVACPCAVGLAVPMVIVIAGGMAARRGVIIKSADTTEGARKTTDVVFDKTGTITEGGLKVIKHVSLQADQDEKEVAGLVMAMVAGGKHPVSAAVEKYLRDDFKTEASPDVSSIRVIAGAGIEANDGQRTLMAGNSRWTKASHLPEVVSIREDGLTEFIVTLDSRPVAAFGLRTQIRPEAERVITDLVGRGITVHMVSGDQPTAVESVAKSVGIAPGNVASERSPASKRDYVEELMADGKRHVMFCGDGTNDAVAVAQAHVGVQMGGGASTSSDMTQSAADVVLLNGLEGIPQLLDVSRAAYARMVFNFAWSAVYNVLAVTMASGAWVDFRIAPAYAGLGEVVSVVPVILAAMSMFLARF